MQRIQRVLGEQTKRTAAERNFSILRLRLSYLNNDLTEKTKIIIFYSVTVYIGEMLKAYV